MNLTTIAQHFSVGQFESTYAFLSEDVNWEVKGASAIYLEGKPAVVEYCNRVAQYFASVETNFKEEVILLDGNNVAISGSAVFKREGEVISNVDSVDVFQFNSFGQLSKITSYCIEVD